MNARTELGYVWCVTCKQETDPLPSGTCGFCDRDPANGVLDVAEAKQQWVYRQRARNKEAAKAYRDRQKDAA